MTETEVREAINQRIRQAIIILNTLDNLAWCAWPDSTKPIPLDVTHVLTEATIASGKLSKALKGMRDQPRGYYLAE